MAKSDYIKRSDAAFAAQLQTCKTNLPGYAATLGVTAQVAAQAADADYFSYLVACQSLMQADAAEWTAWKNLARLGSGPGTPPPANALPPAVAAVAPGIEVRFRAFVKQIKGGANYTVAIGQALGIEGIEQVGPDLATVTPVLTAQTSGNRAEVGWGWGGFAGYLDMIELQVDRGDGKGFVLLANDTSPGYVDTAPFPAAPTKWTYRGLYWLDDQPVGQWSAAVSVMVGG